MFDRRHLTFAILIVFIITFTLYQSHEALPYIQDLHSSKSKLNDWFSTSRPHPEHSEEIPTNNELTSLCDQTQWNQGLWLQCHSKSGKNGTSIKGGLNNARNRIQTCIRLAIDAGAGLILPSIALHRTNPDEQFVEFGNEEECLDNYWDMEYLTKELGKQCPQLQLRHCGDTSGIDKIIPIPERRYDSEPFHTNSFGKMINRQLRSWNIHSITSQKPIAVSFGDPYIAWNYTQSNELSTIQKSLFQILNFSPILVEFSNKLLASPELKDGFIAVHLRGEKDWPAPWGTPQEQTSLFIAEMEALQPTLIKPINTIYVSCGSPSAIATFAEKLRPLNYTVYDKNSLLSHSPALLEKLGFMYFDQKAIVETEVLVAADYWYGVLASTFSEMVAYRRSLGKKGNFFEDHIVPGSRRVEAGGRRWDVAPALLGDERTKLVVVNTGPLDIMDCFP